MAENKEHTLPEEELERLLARSAENGPEPSEALLERVMADADRTLAAQQATVRPRQVRRQGLFAGLGGWPALTGLVTATVAGIWIGFAQPGPVGGIADGMLATDADYDLGDLMPGYETVLVEG